MLSKCFVEWSSDGVVARYSAESRTDVWLRTLNKIFTREQIYIKYNTEKKIQINKTK